MAHFGNKTEAAFIYASLRKVISCWRSSQKASLSLDCSEGKASLNLSCNLGHPDDRRGKSRKSRKTPSRIRRDKARTAKYQNSTKADRSVSPAPPAPVEENQKQTAEPAQDVQSNGRDEDEDYHENDDFQHILTTNQKRNASSPLESSPKRTIVSPAAPPGVVQLPVWDFQSPGDLREETQDLSLQEDHHLIEALDLAIRQEEEDGDEDDIDEYEDENDVNESNENEDQITNHTLRDDENEANDISEDDENESDEDENEVDENYDRYEDDDYEDESEDDYEDDEDDYKDENEYEEDSYEDDEKDRDEYNEDDDEKIEEYEYEEYKRPVYPIVIPPAKLWEFPPTVQLPVWDPRESSDDNFEYTTYEFIHGKWRITC